MIAWLFLTYLWAPGLRYQKSTSQGSLLNSSATRHIQTPVFYSVLRFEDSQGTKNAGFAVSGVLIRVPSANALGLESGGGRGRLRYLYSLPRVCPLPSGHHLDPWCDIGDIGATLVRHEDNMKTMKTRNLRIWLQHATGGLEHSRTWLELDYDFPY